MDRRKRRIRNGGDKMENNGVIIYPTLDEKREVQIAEMHTEEKVIEKNVEKTPRIDGEEDQMERWLD